MLPRWHIILGAVFTFFMWIFAPQIGFVNILLIFIASFMIDLDHYICGAMKTGKLHIGKIFDYHKDVGIKQHEERRRGIRRRGDFHLFHTLEFHVFIALLGILFLPFFYIFIGMAFHSLLDLFWLLKNDFFYRREYFFFNWIRDKI